MLKILKNISCLEIVLFVLLISLAFIFLFKKKQEGFIEEKNDFIRHTDNDIYDNFYANVYDKILFNQDKNNFEIDHIFSTPKASSFVLDIGCGTGHHIKQISDLKIKCIGVDNSSAMIKKAKSNYPGLKYKLANVLNTMEFEENIFSHILCLYFTIYYFKDKHKFLENCYQWLKPNGILVIHLVNLNKFDPIVPNATSFDQESKRPTHSEITFDQFTYRSEFKQNKNIDFNTINLKQPNVTFRETFKFNNKNKARVNEHKLYMSSQSSILAIAREVGFILQSQTEIGVETYEHNYLYTLQKPQ